MTSFRFFPEIPTAFFSGLQFSRSGKAPGIILKTLGINPEIPLEIVYGFETTPLAIFLVIPPGISSGLLPGSSTGIHPETSMGIHPEITP